MTHPLKKNRLILFKGFITDYIRYLESQGPDAAKAAARLRKKREGASKYPPYQNTRECQRRLRHRHAA